MHNPQLIQLVAFGRQSRVDQTLHGGQARSHWVGEKGRKSRCVRLQGCIRRWAGGGCAVAYLNLVPEAVVYKPEGGEGLR